MNITQWIRERLCADILTENVELRARNKRLQNELTAKGNVFFIEHRWLATDELILGTVVDGQMHETYCSSFSTAIIPGTEAGR